MISDPDITATDETKAWPDTFTSKDDLPPTAPPPGDSKSTRLTG
jgi:hypothetical protein